MKKLVRKMKACCMACMMILAAYGSVNKVSSFKFFQVPEYKVLKISTKELYDTWVKYTWRKDITCDHLIITGKLDRNLFWYVEQIASECKILDLLDAETDVIPLESFVENDDLIKVILPKNLKKIENCCFSRCDMLETVILPESLEEIEYSTFVSCPRLKLEIPSTIKIYSHNFSGSPGVKMV